MIECMGIRLCKGERVGGSSYEPVEGGRDCAIVAQLTLENWLEGGSRPRDKVRVVKPGESWEGKWNEYAGG